MDVDVFEGKPYAASSELAEDRDHAVPLCVDLDGTLVRTDILLESLFLFLKRHFLQIFLLPFWLWKGRAFLKQQIARKVEFEPSLLPYREDLLAYLREQRRAGRSLVLATACDAKLARQVAGYLGIFDEVLASDGMTNLSGARKADRLVEVYGERGFDYVGNDAADVPVWHRARRAIVVDAGAAVRRAAERNGNVAKFFEGRRGGFLEYLRAIRMYQWVKNLLIFVPLVAAHELTNLALLQKAFVAFLAFSLCASSVYLLNDLLDLEADRRHARKRFRPLAAGTVPIAHGVLLIPLLLGAAFGMGALLAGNFVSLLAVYWVITVAYSLWLKSLLVLDVLVLACLYTLRIIAGGEAVDIMPSFWLLAFSMFLFFGLAIVKRASELVPLQNADKVVKVRSYRPIDLDALTSLGVPSGQLAVLVLAFYINSDDIVQMYAHPRLIWLLCPLLLYWLARVWLLTWRGKMHDDPIVFALRDKVSLGVAVVALLIIIAAL